MLWVFRRRRDDIPYASLWIAFVLFIFACGTTHFLHAASVLFGTPMLAGLAAVHVTTAAVSIATALALTVTLPKINLLPSPKRQKRELELAVRQATLEKDALLVELNHRVGHQLAKLLALTRHELRQTGDVSNPGLRNIEALLNELAAEHHRLSRAGYAETEHPARFFLRHAGSSDRV